MLAEQSLGAGATSGPKHALVLPNPLVGSDAARMVEYGVAAEEAGWDGVFMWDVLVNPPPPDERGAAADPEPWHPEEFQPLIDPLITLAGIASRTHRIRLGTWIIPLARRQPWQVARDVATLDRLSNGRVILGVGLGRRPDYDLLGTPWEPSTVAARYDEALGLLDRFWTGEAVHHDGEHFQVDGVAVLPTPVQRPRIPVWVAAFWPNPRPVRRAAQWDGIMPVLNPDLDGPDLQAFAEQWRSLSEVPGDVFLVISPDKTTKARIERYRDMGITWLASYCLDPAMGHDGILGRIAQGPPPSA